MCPFSAFYNDNRDKLFGYLLRRTGDPNLAKDIMQESFTRYLEYYGGTKINTTLLFTIARHILVDNHRNAKWNVPHEGILQDPGNPEEQLMVREEYRLILRAIQKLDTVERDILALVVGSRMSYQEIAKITGFSESNVKVKVHRARVKLKDFLKKVDEEAFPERSARKR